MTGIKPIHPLLDAQALQRAAAHILLAAAILDESDRSLWADELTEKAAEMVSRAERLEREYFATKEAGNVATFKRPAKSDPAPNVVPVSGHFNVEELFRIVGIGPFSGPSGSAA